MPLRRIQPGQADYPTQVAALCRRSTTADPAVEAAVAEVLAAVRARGDAAVREYTERFEQRDDDPRRYAEPDSYELRLDDAYHVPSAVMTALGRAAGRIRAFHERQRETGYALVEGGARLELRVEPLERVGIYVPGGTAAYPSSVLMNAIPARVAGVDEIIMVCPRVSPAVLAAARLAGVDRLFEIGGAQAVAALAYGTASVPRVDKVVGPGNQWVATAKRLVFGEVDIDSIAGPSEVLIIADDGADPRLVAADLLAQAEHDVEARPILVTTSAALADAVDAELERQLATLPRRDIAAASVTRWGVALVVADVDAALAFAARYAPEHLELLVREPRAVAARARGAGAIFVGPWTPEAAGDYLAGPNHVLPTGGAARYASPLGVYDFIKRTSVLELDRAALDDLAADIQALADAEGLHAHAHSVALRFDLAPAHSVDRAGAGSPLAPSPGRSPSALRGEGRGGVVGPLVRDELARLDAYEVPRPPGVRAKLDANESPWPLPADIAAALGRELATVPLHRYPAADAAELRAVIAAELGVPPATLCFGNGSDELIAMLVAAFSRPRPGRERAAVLFPSPTFVYYRLATAIAGLEPVEVPLDAEMRLDEPALAAALAAARPNLAFFARPNNPTGGLWPAAAVLRTAREHPDTLVIDDEAYIDYGGDSLVDACRDLPNLVIMRTLSKIGMASLRLGYVHAHPDVLRELEKVRPPYNVGALNQRAAAWLLANHRDLLRGHCAAVAAERTRVAAALAARPGIHTFDSRANLILFRVGTAGDGRATTVWRALADRGVLVRTFDAPGPLSGCLRVSIGTPEENDLFLAVLTEVLVS